MMGTTPSARPVDCDYVTILVLSIGLSRDLLLVCAVFLIVVSLAWLEAIPVSR